MGNKRAKQTHKIPPPPQHYRLVTNLLLWVASLQGVSSTIRLQHSGSSFMKSTEMMKVAVSTKDEACKREGEEKVTR